MTKLAAALLILALNYYTYHHLARGAEIPPRESFAEFPLQLEAWSCPERGDVAPEVWAGLGATDILLCNYHRRDPNSQILVYVGYHETQVREEGGGAGENSIHPPAHCLPGSGWDIIDNRTVALDLPGRDDRPEVKRLMIARGVQRQLVYYWYQSRGRIISEDWQKIVYVGWDRATMGRTDGSLVRFTIPVVRGDEEQAEEAFRELAPLVLERLDAYVPV